MQTVMVVWAFKTVGACLAVWVIGSIGGVRASLVGMGRVIAAIVAACVMLLRFPIWAPQFALFARLGLVVIYFFTRRGRPKYLVCGARETHAVVVGWCCFGAMYVCMCFHIYLTMTTIATVCIISLLLLFVAACMCLPCRLRVRVRLGLGLGFGWV